MARTNKYTSINFNHIYEKPNLTNPNNTSTSNNTNNSKTKLQPLSYSSVSSTRAHGRMLVLTRPTPKPISVPTPTSSITASTSTTPITPKSPIGNSDRSVQESDQISLRPLGRTGAPNSSASSPVLESPKPDKFVPPHLRPGFVGREERPGPEVYRGKEIGQRVQQQQQVGGFYGSPGRFGGEEARPKSGGHERMRRGGDSDLGFLNRPRSSGNRPSSSG